MSNPMNMFRKRQKLMLALLGVICMLAFLVVPIVMDMGQSRAVEDPVLATTSYGKIRRSEMEDMQRARSQANLFLASLLHEAGRRVSDQPLGDDDPRSVVDAMILAKKAEELGMVVSDQAVNEFLKMVTQDKVTGKQLRDVIAAQSNRVSPQRLYDILRHEIMAYRMAELFGGGFNGLPPAQRWEYYLRLRRNATAQLLPLSVADFIKDVGRPKDAELAEYFDKYKEVEPLPFSPEPGFKIPRKFSVQYLKANYQEQVDRIAKELTDEDIEEFYEKNKDTRYTALNLPFEDESPTTTPKPSDDRYKDRLEGGAATGDVEVESLELPVREDLKSGLDASTDGVEAEPTSPNENEDAVEAPTETDEPSSEAPSSDESDEESTEESTEPAADEPAAGDSPDEGDSGAANPARTRRVADEGQLLAYAEELAFLQDDGAREEPSTDDAATDGSEDQQPVEGATTDSATVNDGTAESEAGAGEVGAGEVGAGEASAGEEQNDGPAATPKSPSSSKYQPLSEIKDRVRRDLAASLATERISKVMEEIKPEFDTYYYDRVNAEAEQGAKKPAQPNLEVLTTHYGLTDHELKLLSLRELSETDVGKSSDPKTALTGQPVSLLQMLFTAMQPYKPVITDDSEGNQYLVWKTEDQPERVPKLDDPGIRQIVEDAWRLEQAREPAQKRAEELAAQAREKKEPLTQSLADQKHGTVVATDPFPWLTQSFFSFPPPPPSISPVRGVDKSVLIAEPGEAFMETVFGLDQGGVGVAFDQSKKNVYVIQVESFAPSETVLRETFLHDRFGLYAEVARLDAGRASEEWMNALREEVGLDWEQSPDLMAAR
jgi:hypothetical protein